VLALTFEGFLFYASIVGVVVGFIAYRIYLASRRVGMWKNGHAPGHESFMELPYPRDMAFLAAREVLPRHYSLEEIGDRERIVLGTKKVWIIRTDRVSVKVNPTLAGCEVIFARLGPLWWRQQKGVPAADAQAFFDDLVSTLSAWHATGYGAGDQTAQDTASPLPTPSPPTSPPEPSQPGWVHSGGTGLTPGA
jgi:hypothetical protein